MNLNATDKNAASGSGSGASTNLNDATRRAIREWLAMHNGNVEGLARWMSRSLRVGGIKVCRAMVLEAVA